MKRNNIKWMCVFQITKFSFFDFENYEQHLFTIRIIFFTASTLRKMDHKTWMLKVKIVFGNIKYVKAYDL